MVERFGNNVYPMVILMVFMAFCTALRAASCVETTEKVQAWRSCAHEHGRDACGAPPWEGAP